MAKLSTQEIIDAIKELTVLELNDLVKACEEEFGVSAAAGVVVAAAADAGAAEEEKTELYVKLQVLALKKQRILLIPLLRFSRKVSPRKKLRTSRAS